MLPLGSKEKPLKVVCDSRAKYYYRFIYVAVDDDQAHLIRDLETRELQRLDPIHNSTKASNIHWGECKLRIPRSNFDLTSCHITTTIVPGPFRNRRNRTTVDLFATDIKVVKWGWCGCL